MQKEEFKVVFMHQFSKWNKGAQISMYKYHSNRDSESPYLAFQQFVSKEFKLVANVESIGDYTVEPTRFYVSFTDANEHQLNNRDLTKMGSDEPFEREIVMEEIHFLDHSITFSLDRIKVKENQHVFEVMNRTNIHHLRYDIASSTFYTPTELIRSRRVSEISGDIRRNSELARIESSYVKFVFNYEANQELETIAKKYDSSSRFGKFIVRILKNKYNIQGSNCPMHDILELLVFEMYNAKSE